MLSGVAASPIFTSPMTVVVGSSTLPLNAFSAVPLMPNVSRTSYARPYEPFGAAV